MQLNWNESDNLTMLTDFYELTMSQAYLSQGLENIVGTFDLYFRRVPENGGFAVMAGVEQAISYLENLRFLPEDLEYLRSLHHFTPEFLKYLEASKFSCDIWAIPEGTPVFPGEPLVKVRGPIIQAQMLETMLLLTINHQTLIATKANRIARAANGRSVMEFGARRAQGCDASVLGARAAYIGGVDSTSCTIAGQYFDVPLSGTMAHSFVMVCGDEYNAFKSYALTYPDNTVLLIDTYNTLQSGLPNAIRVAKEVLEPMGKRLKGIRIDSGDLTYLTKKTRAALDAAGLQDCKIVVSNALDEYLIRDLLRQGACIDAFGVGERLITSRAEPVFGGVYKLVEYAPEQKEIPVLKISENPEKITTPGDKQVWRFFDKTTGNALADVITVVDEVLPSDGPYEIFDPLHTWKTKIMTNYTARPLLQPIFINGKCVYQRRSMQEIRTYCRAEVGKLWDSILRFENPQTYYVDLSPRLWRMKDELLHALAKH